MEVHWTLLQDSSKDPEAVAELWARARPADFFGVRAWELTPRVAISLPVLPCRPPQVEHAQMAGRHSRALRFNSGRLEPGQETPSAMNLRRFAEPTLASCSLLFDTPVPEDFGSRSFPYDVRLFPNRSILPSPGSRRCFIRGCLNGDRRSFAGSLKHFLSPTWPTIDSSACLRRLLPLYVLRPLRLSFKWSWRFLRVGLARLTRNAV